MEHGAWSISALVPLLGGVRGGLNYRAQVAGQIKESHELLSIPGSISQKFFHCFVFPVLFLCASLCHLCDPLC